MLSEPNISPFVYRRSRSRQCIAMSNTHQASPFPRAVRFATTAYLAPGTLGLVEIIPLYFAEALINQRQPPAITHAEFYYGFLGVTLAWQVDFLVIAIDPVRFRPLMPVSWIEKGLYPIAVAVLVSAGRTSTRMVPAAALDVVWLALFMTAWVRTKDWG